MATKVDCNTGFGGLWFAGWLFSLGYLNLGFWKGILALIIWPYYLGVGLAPITG